VGFFWRVERAEVTIRLIDDKACFPSVAATAAFHSFLHAMQTLASICLILGMGSLAKIDEPIVAGVAVDMVDFFRWPCTAGVCPCHYGRKKIFSINLQMIASLSKPTRSLS
jgi:hypothetical protein